MVTRDVGMKSSSIHHWQTRLATGHTETWLKTAIILVALGFIVAAMFINNRWILAGMFLYLALP